MAVVAPQAATEFHWGLRAQPNYDEMLQASKKSSNIPPPPDRLSKWMALSPYRTLILAANKRLHELELEQLGYVQSGAPLPLSVASVRPRGADEAWARNSQYNDDLDATEAMERERLEAERRFDEETAQQRASMLSRMSRGVPSGIRVANNLDGEEADEEELIPDNPGPYSRSGYSTPVRMPVGAGQYVPIRPGRPAAGFSSPYETGRRIEDTGFSHPALGSRGPIPRLPFVNPRPATTHRGEGFEF